MTGYRRRLRQVYFNPIIIVSPAFRSYMVSNMLNFGLFLLTAILAGGRASAAGVTGAAEGFAKGVTGGGSATAVYPSTNAELVSCKYILLLQSFLVWSFLSSQNILLGTLIQNRSWRLFGSCDHPHKDLRLHRHRRDDLRDGMCAIWNCIWLPDCHQPEQRTSVLWNPFPSVVCHPGIS